MGEVYSKNERSDFNIVIYLMFLFVAIHLWISWMNEIAFFVEYIGALLRIYAGWRVREMSDM